MRLDRDQFIEQVVKPSQQKSGQRAQAKSKCELARELDEQIKAEGVKVTVLQPGESGYPKKTGKRLGKRTVNRLFNNGF